MKNQKFVHSTYSKIADTYTKLYFDDLSDSPIIDTFLGKLTPFSKILDIGCGPGTFCQYIYSKGFTVEGIDKSKKMVHIAKQKVVGVKFQVMDMRNLTYPQDYFDGLLAAYSLIHIHSDEIVSTLTEFGRVLKPNGLLLLIAQAGEADKIVDEPLKKGEKIFVNFFSKERLTLFLKLAGFGILSFEEIPMKNPSPLSDRVIYAIVKK